MTVEAPETGVEESTSEVVEEVSSDVSEVEGTTELTENEPAKEVLSGLDALKEKAAKAKAGDVSLDKTPKDLNGKKEKVAPEKPFEASLSYKVRDEELKMDDWVKDKIASEEDQKMFQELYTRGHGLEIAKQERDDYRTKLGNLDANLHYLTNAVKTGDVEGFITTLGLPKEAFIKYAIDELKYQEMPAEEKAQLDQQKQMHQYQRNLMAQNEQMQQEVSKSRINSLNLEIDTSVNSAQYNDIAQSYDARVGRPGAFKDVIKERGIFHEKVHGRELTVQEAIEDAIKLIGGYQAAGAQPNLSQQTGSVGTPTVQQTQQMNKPVLPNLQGQGTSPTKRMPNSIADLKGRYRELTGQQ